MTSMGKFYPWIRRHSPVVNDYIRSVGFSRLSADYESFGEFLIKHNAPQNVRDECALAKEVYDRPAPPKMTKEHKEHAVRICLDRISEHPIPPDFQDTRIEFYMDGYKYHVRRSVEPDETKTEYHIQAHNLELTKLKREYHGWGGWVYVDLPGHMCHGQHKPLPGTHFCVDWHRRGFNW